ncbi:hypothetical protein [Paenilisteria rocourtiae]|uniref:Uncharacterized protein n=1 Tax=Listeria rocourtiae TaxID=647910 RepID=A0A4R6ZNH6_9LIST|nr:hypothetical protein [Listeria rocourtiae]EUJ51822.1 hypothetical protein PROCOU_01587 [Listeria rocourtiae FSL F6-920]TDR53912.1 hypothetical protein DFP96_1036 [Listeria rocourtiae]
MTEKEQNQLAFYNSFYGLVWESGWLSSDTAYDLSKQAQQESGFNAFGEEVEREIGAWRVKSGEMYWTGWGEDGTHPTFALDTAPDSLSDVPTFNSKRKAEEVAEIFGGEVERVEEGEHETD